MDVPVATSAAGTAQQLMHVIGVVEIAAGRRVRRRRVAVGDRHQPADRRRPGYYDIALRDFGLMLGALTFGRLALAVVPARTSGALPARPF
jgi:hypothetical protein